MKRLLAFAVLVAPLVAAADYPGQRIYGSPYAQFQGGYSTYIQPSVQYGRQMIYNGGNAVVHGAYNAGYYGYQMARGTGHVLNAYRFGTPVMIMVVPSGGYNYGCMHCGPGTGYR